MIQPHRPTSRGTRPTSTPRSSLTGSASTLPDLLDRWQRGCDDSARDVLTLVYGELRTLARRYLNQERVDHTLQPTALVHEVFIRMVKGSAPGVSSRQELVRIAAHVMRQVLVNHANRRRTLRRGRDGKRVGLDPALMLFEDRCIDLLELDEALERLGQVDPRQAAVVELRFFGGMTAEDTARILDVSLRTVERDWMMARAWLRTEIAG